MCQLENVSIGSFFHCRIEILAHCRIVTLAHCRIETLAHLHIRRFLSLFPKILTHKIQRQ